MLELTEAEQTFTFPSVPEACEISLLRDFSAPIKLSPFQGDTSLAFLMAHDSDAFNRWNAAQTLAAKLLLQRVREVMRKKETKETEEEGDKKGETEKGDKKETDQKPFLSNVYKEAFQTALMDENCDKSIKVRTLCLLSLFLFLIFLSLFFTLTCLLSPFICLLYSCFSSVSFSVSFFLHPEICFSLPSIAFLLPPPVITLPLTSVLLSPFVFFCLLRP